MRRAVKVLVPQRAGRAHFGCPTCGDVFTLPWEEGERLPWCLHAETYSWRTPHPQTQAGPFPWTQMVRVKVETA